MMTGTKTRALALIVLVLALMGARSAHPALAGSVVTDCPATESALSADIASAGASGTVTFNCSAATTVDFISTITISQSVTLDGRSSHPVILNGMGSVQLFSVRTPAGSVATNFTVNGLTLTHGKATGYGGAINDSTATVTVLNSTLTYNSATSGGNAIFNGNSGRLFVKNSTLAHNGNGGNGGALFNQAQAEIDNSTLADNTATYAGGAVFNNTGGYVYISASILAHNLGSSRSWDNCNGAMVDYGFNVTLGDDCGLTGSNDFPNTNPDLKALAYNGGPTETMALDANSKAVDRIYQGTNVCLATDQRGVSRFDDRESYCDVGAYEHVDHLRVEIDVTGAQYSVYIDGANLLVPSTLNWHALSPHGDHSGSDPVNSSAVHIFAFSHPCPSGHITVDASAKDATGQDATAHYEGDPC